VRDKYNILNIIPCVLRNLKVKFSRNVEILGLSGIKHRFDYIIDIDSKKYGVIITSDVNEKKLFEVSVIHLDTNINIILLHIGRKGTSINTSEKLKDRIILVDGIEGFINYLKRFKKSN